MTRFRPHPSHDHDRNPKDELDDALEALVRGDRRGLDALDPEMRATVDQMYRWADESGLCNEPLPRMRPSAWDSARWISRVSSVAAAAILVGIIAFGTFLFVDLSGDDPTPESFPAASGNHLDREASGIGDTRFLTEAEAIEDIYLAFSDYRWPNAYRPTPTDIADYYLGGDDPFEPSEERRYPSGIGHGLIATFHSCAWFMNWLDAYQSGDSGRQTEALAVLTDVLPWHPNYDDGTRAPFQEAASYAARGDPSLVARQIERNECADLPFTSTAEDDGGDTLEDSQWREQFENVNCSNVLPSGQTVPCYPGTPTTPED